MSLFDIFRRKQQPKPVETPALQDPQEFLEHIRKLLPTAAVVQLKHTPGYRQAVREGMEAIKPPSDPATDGWTWAAWSKEMQTLAFPGWSPCRFAHRMTTNASERAWFVFGLTSGPFGMWQKNFDVCGQDVEDGEWKKERTILTCLTHLPSGIGLGIFKNKDAAALAADTAIRTAPELADVDHLPDHLMQRTSQSWQMLGIVPSDNAHARDIDHGTGPYFIMGIAENVEDGKPAKLS